MKILQTEFKPHGCTQNTNKKTHTPKKDEALTITKNLDRHYRNPTNSFKNRDKLVCNEDESERKEEKKTMR